MRGGGMNGDSRVGVWSRGMEWALLMTGWKNRGVQVVVGIEGKL